MSARTPFQAEIRRRVHRAFTTQSFRSAIRSNTGAIDLASIMVGVIAIGVIAGIIAATVFAVIPWAQDKEAMSSLESVRVSESVAYVQNTDAGAGIYLDLAGLVGQKLIQDSKTVAVGVDGAGACYLAVSKSPSGKVFYVTDKSIVPSLLTISSVTGCLSSAGAQSLASGVGAPATPLPAVSASAFKFGVAEPSLAGVEMTARALGEYPGLVVTYSDFGAPIDVAGINTVIAHGSRPVITWEPWLAGQGVTQPDFTLGKLIDGSHDAYITSAADQLLAAGNPKISIRFAHEMNGSWYPWAEQVNGNQPGQYAQAWRHVVDIFDAKGLNNIDWVWAPNVPDYGTTAYAGLYPGSSYVDHTALDGFNWGTTNTSSDGTWTSSWQAPWDLFYPGLDALHTVAPDKGAYITETASVPTEGAKTQEAWIADTAYYLHHYGDTAGRVTVEGFVWFDFIKGDPNIVGSVVTNWRFDATDASAAAMKTALTRP